MADPKQLASKEFAIELNQNYINSRSAAIRTAIGSDDADAVWFPFDELENYLAYIKSQAADKGYSVDGVRFYLGVYPNDSNLGSKAGKTTIFLSPTGRRSNDTSAPPAQSVDISDIKPLNFGSIGDPPTISYPLL